MARRTATTLATSVLRVDAGVAALRGRRRGPGAVFAALADPVRLRLLSLIADAGEVCSCDLVEPIGKSQPTVSHHTKALADAGLDHRREARPLGVVDDRSRTPARRVRAALDPARHA